MPANLENSAVATGLERSIFIPIPKKGNGQRMSKLPDNCTHLRRRSSNAQNSPRQASTVRELWTSRCSSWFLKKAEEPEIKLPTSTRSLKTQENYKKKKIYFCFIDYAKAFDFGSQQTGKFFKRQEYQTTLPASREICMQVKNQQLELDMEQQTGSKSGKEYVKGVCCHPAYLTYMQITSCKMPGWMKHKVESRLLGKISITSDTQITPPSWQKEKN